MKQWQYLPMELEKHQDRVLYFNRKWCILDGIDINGNELECGLVSVTYRNGKYWVRQRASFEMWEHDMFWRITRNRVAEKLSHLRKEIEE